MLIEFLLCQILGLVFLSRLIFATTLWAPYIIAQGTNNTFSNLPNLYAIERVEQRYDPKRCDFSTHTINHEAVPPLQAALWENDSPVTCWREWLLKSTAVMSFYYWWHQRGSLVAQMVKNLSTMQETWVQSLGRKDPLKKGMATHSSILAWRIPWIFK